MTNTNNMAARPQWADQPLRIDPFALPQTVQRSDAGRARYTVAAGGTTVKTTVGGDLPLSLALPNRAFQGVAARAFENVDGSMTVTLELLMPTPRFACRFVWPTRWKTPLPTGTAGRAVWRCRSASRVGLCW